ncbi:MAG: (Fe-S)-binding protein, partial [Desulfobacteraceae bacterium]|nr:(Fe-S)-binding protein [Desulfobacteraceae bacterium]
YWPAMSRGLSGAERKQAEALAEKTLDISQFLVDKLGVTARNAPEDAPGTMVTYHDPCHLKKSLGIGAQPRTILAASGGCRLVEMDEPDRCCGCGGSFNLQHYGLSASIGKRKREDILRTGCAVVATSCPACMLHIADMLSRAGDRVRVRHTIEIYAESLARR